MFGFGVLAYDPFWSYTYGYPAYGYGAYSLAPSYRYTPYPADTSGPTGGLRLKITPKTAQVFVDGYYAGIVDDFNGRFQHLNLTPGPHHVEVRAPGYEPHGFEVDIEEHHTTEYNGTLPRATSSSLPPA
jgi:hypothetical protein